MPPSWSSGKAFILGIFLVFGESHAFHHYSSVKTSTQSPLKYDVDPEPQYPSESETQYSPPPYEAPQSQYSSQAQYSPPPYEAPQPQYSSQAQYSPPVYSPPYYGAAQTQYPSPYYGADYQPQYYPPQAQYSPPYPSTYEPYSSPQAQYFPPQYSPSIYTPQNPYAPQYPPSNYGAGSQSQYSPPQYSPQYGMILKPQYTPQTQYPNSYYEMEAEEYINGEEETYGPPISKLYVEQYGEEDVEYYYPGRAILDSKGRFLFQWVVDYPGKIVTFNITVRNRGWIGIGLSVDGSMKSADFMIAGVKGYNEPYIGDYYSDTKRRLYSDSKQDWSLIYAEEYNGLTHLQVSRMLDTCDSQDIPITEDLLHVIWAYGEGDGYDYHFDKRGNYRVYLMDPVLTTYETPLMEWSLSDQVTLLEKETTYWCSIHKGPHLLSKHHIVEVHPFLKDNLTVTHTHHMILWRCVAPPGMNAEDIFESLVGFGEECYFNEDRVIPIHLCKMIVTGWAFGGKPLILPYSVGFPIGSEFNEYYMLEIHFNNPELLTMTLESGFNLFYTNKLRKNDGGGLFVHYDFFSPFLIPPITTNLELYGLCSPDCTKEMIPSSGIEIHAVILHTHYSGRKLKLQHFRYGVELPWIAKDDNYDASFQQWRILLEPRLVLPGDELVMRCEYDNTWTNGTVVGGWATRDEMCFAGLLINQIIPYFTCTSRIPDSSILPLIGVREYEWDFWTQERVVTDPSILAGRLLTDVSDSIDWTKPLRYKLQGVTAYTEQNVVCPQILIPTPSQQARAKSPGISSVHHETNTGSTSTKTQTSKLQGKVISSDADPANIVELAKGFGETTLMGENKGVPKSTPGSISQTVYPFRAQKYRVERYCRNPNLYGFYNYYTSPAATSAYFNQVAQPSQSYPY